MLAMLGSQILTPHLPGCQDQRILSYPAMGDYGDGDGGLQHFDEGKKRNCGRLGGTKTEEG